MQGMAAGRLTSSFDIQNPTDNAKSSIGHLHSRQLAEELKILYRRGSCSEET
jgi:hypothetical protein